MKELEAIWDRIRIWRTKRDVQMPGTDVMSSYECADELEALLPALVQQIAALREPMALAEQPATMTVYQQDEVQWFTKPELAAYVREKVDRAHAEDQAVFDSWLGRQPVEFEPASTPVFAKVMPAGSEK